MSFPHTAAMNTTLRHLLEVWHPRYRGRLCQLLVYGAAVAGLAYVENSCLQALVESLSAAPDGGGAVVRLARALAGAGGVPFTILGAIVVVGLLRAVLGSLCTVVGSKLSIASREDLERAVLYHLMHLDDAFFTRHSLGEIINRLEVDLYRII